MAGGHSVEWFSASFPGAPAAEVLDGVNIVRAGRQWTVHWRAFRHYHRSLQGRFDVVIDEVNTMPFFTPLWAGIPTFMMIFQLAREVWWYESQFPLSAIGYTLEPAYLRFYKQTPVFTISRSTEKDLRKLGFVGPITLVPIGIDKIVPAEAAKAETPTFLYVGRLAPSKRIEHLLHALALFRQSTGSGTLWLVGKGSPHYQRSLVKLADRLNITDGVSFKGHVAQTEKYGLMSEAHALLMTSAREGWGLVVTEANACGTPAIVYDVAGLRDSVRNESTGLIVEPTPLNLCNAMIRLIGDPALYERLASEGRLWSHTFSLDATALVVENAIARSGRQHTSPADSRSRPSRPA